jgi:hypothetical protein
MTNRLTVKGVLVAALVSGPAGIVRTGVNGTWRSTGATGVSER